MTANSKNSYHTFTQNANTLVTQQMMQHQTPRLPSTHLTSTTSSLEDGGRDGGEDLSGSLSDRKVKESSLLNDPIGILPRMRFGAINSNN